MRHEVDVLKRLIWFYVIERPSLAILQAGQRKIIRGLFTMYEEACIEKKQTRISPVLVAERLDAAATDDAKRRVVVDYIASLTEEGAVGIYRRLAGISGGSIAEAAGRLI